MTCLYCGGPHDEDTACPPIPKAPNDDQIRCVQKHAAPKGLVVIGYERPFRHGRQYPEAEAVSRARTANILALLAICETQRAEIDRLRLLVQSAHGFSYATGFSRGPDAKEFTAHCGCGLWSQEADSILEASEFQAVHVGDLLDVMRNTA